MVAYGDILCAIYLLIKILIVNNRVVRINTVEKVIIS